VRVWPAHFSSVVAVDYSTGVSSGQIQRRAGSLVEFAAYGGVRTRLPWKNKTMRNIAGTSFSAPVATGLIAKILSIHPGIHPDQMKMILREISEPSE
jgi:hypothetical protein